jgi:hypothetical protein
MQKVFKSLVFLCACPPRRTGLYVFARRKKKKRIARKDAKPQSQSAAAESHTERTIISLRLPTAGRPLRLCEKKNPPRRTRNSAGQALRLGEKKKKELRAKTPSRKGLRKVDRQDGIMLDLK